MKKMSQALRGKSPISGRDLMYHLNYEALQSDVNAIAHAVSHVDDLAGALEVLLSASKDEMGNVYFYQAQKDAEKALEAYRGAK